MGQLGSLSIRRPLINFTPAPTYLGFFSFYAETDPGKRHFILLFSQLKNIVIANAILGSYPGFKTQTDVVLLTLKTSLRCSN